jgi:WD40 repeat protein
MDVCLKKQIVATCSSDRTVRVWNYSAKDELIPDITMPFEEEAFSVAIHPSGFHMVVGFNDCIRMLNILQEELQEYCKIPIPGSREIKFSHGGHLFACQHNSAV